ncbi:MAG: helix-turn-helix transcriptional regulator [Treponema sp.]|jgi:transcriptional regulator with XRE-family HTH domain|nr:helix-turn-helix transcriptional regulator [Treponema sp.]
MTGRVSFTDKMRKIRDVLAENLKENRRLRGLTQEQLAEKTGISSHYVAMVETRKTFPKPEMLERFAKTFGIEPYQLFTVENDPNEPNERLHKKIVTEMKHMATDIKQIVKETVRETINEECKYNKKK